jgi:intracellular sulfur oxidation DsrE/DsrF family protein
MSKYLLIQSRDAYESTAVRDHVEWAGALRRRGLEVAFYLVQNGVLSSRSGADNEELQEAMKAGIEVLADGFSLRERGVALSEVARGVRPATIETVVDRLAAGWKVMFL